MLSKLSQIVSDVSSFIFLCIFYSMLGHERREGWSGSLHACMFWQSSQASSPDNSVGRIGSVMATTHLQKLFLDNAAKVELDLGLDQVSADHDSTRPATITDIIFKIIFI